MLKKADFIKTIKVGQDEYLAYHTLFGNLRTLNKSALDLLDQFNQPRDERFFSPDKCNGLLNTLKEIHFLKDDATDERQIMKDEIAWRQTTLKSGAYLGGLQLSVSDACNFSCVYCFADSTDKRSPERKRASGNKAKLMSFATARATIDKVLKVISANGGDSLVVKFFGREPMLNWKTIKQIIEFYQRSSQGIDIYYSITSNGSFITQDVAKLMKDYDFQVTVSVDGVNGSNDVNRPLKNGGGSFALINESLKNLFKYRVNFDFSAVISDKNFDTIDNDFVDYASSLDVKEIKILFAMQGDYLRKENTDEIIKKVMELYKYARTREIAVTGYWYNPFSQLVTTSKTARQQHIKRTVQDGCAATGFQLSVEPSGDIFPCRAMSTYLGHISEINKMFLSDNYEKVMQRIYGNVTDCRGCEIEGFCQGECLGNSEELFGDFYRVDRRFCRIYQRLVRELLIFEASRSQEKKIAADNLSENILTSV